MCLPTIEGYRGVSAYEPEKESELAMGIGTMILFIAMVLVAGIVAHMIVSTGSLMEIQSGTIGTQMIEDVSSGLKVSTIQGHNTSGLIDRLVILITPRAGSPDTDLNRVLVELPEEGAWSIIQFRTPSSFVNPILIL